MSSEQTPDKTPASATPPGTGRQHEAVKEVFRDFRQREEAMRDEVRQELALREQRMRMSSLREEEETKARLEARLRNRLVREEEERYFTSRGYVRYVNRYGQVEWIPAEEAARRRQHRRKEMLMSMFSGSGRKVLRKWLIALAILVAIAIVGFALHKSFRYGPTRYGSIVVNSDIERAAIWVDGRDTGFLTPRQIDNLTEGLHTVTVAKEGYIARPIATPVEVTPKETQTLYFELINIPILGKVAIEANVTGEFQLYIDGQLTPLDENRQLMIPVGYHVFTPVKEGYLCDPAWQRVLVTREETTRLTFTFNPDKDLGYLQIFNDAPYGYVYLNGRFTGLRADGSLIPVRADTYEVSVLRNGYRVEPLKQIINVLRGSRNRLTFRLAELKTDCRLALRTTTPGARVVLNGEFLPHVTPVPDLAVSPGEHYLNLCVDGRWCQPEDFVVRAEPGATAPLSFDF